MATSSNDIVRIFSRAAVEAPFFRTNERVDSERRLLLISYFFSPINVVGSLRWHAMAKYLARHGWALDVVMVDPTKGSSVDPASVTSIDADSLAALPAGTTLYTLPDRIAWTLATQRRLWKMVRPLVRGSSDGRAHEVTGDVPTVEAPRRKILTGLLARQHYRQLMRWAHDAADTGVALVSRRKPDVIVSSGPPHSAHEAARIVSVRTGVPWIMDMRDPWASPENMPRALAGRTWMRLTHRYESRCIEQACRVVANTEPARLDLCVRYPSLSGKFATVLNGADPIDVPDPVVTRPNRFTIRYAGNIYFGRDPGPLLKAVARVAHDLDLSPDAFGVEFLGGGELARTSIAAAAAETGSSAFVTCLPARPRNEALEFLAGATMLVALPQYARLAIPAKVFEYVQFKAWLLVLADRDSATELLFRESGADLVEPNDVSGIAARIRCRYEQFRAGVRPNPLNADGRFDRSRQAEAMLRLLDVCSATQAASLNRATRASA